MNNLVPVFLSFLFYLVASILSTKNDSNAYYYASSWLSCLTIIGHTINANIKNQNLTFPKEDVLKLLLLLLLLTLSILYRVEYFQLTFVMLVVSFTIYVNYINLYEEQVIKLLNTSFAIYLFLSVCGMYDVLFSSPKDTNSFNYDFGLFSFETLYGIEGSTANIDSFSGIIFLINLFRKKTNKVLFCALPLIALLWTTRFTPLVALILSGVSFYFIRDRLTSLFSIFSLFLGFFLSIYILKTHSKFVLVSGLTVSDILFLATHGRSGIWLRQLSNISEHFHFFDYLFGNFSLAEVEIPWRAGYTSNSHNSFMNLFLRGGIISITLILFLIQRIYNSFNRKVFPIIIAIMIAATTNSSIFYVSNPLYLLILIFYSHKRFNEKKGMGQNILQKAL